MRNLLITALLIGSLRHAEGVTIAESAAPLKKSDIVAQKEFFREMSVKRGTLLFAAFKRGSGRAHFDLLVFACKADNCQKVALFYSMRFRMDPNEPLEMSYAENEDLLTLRTDDDMISMRIAPDL